MRKALTLSALVLLAFIAMPAFGDVTLLSASTATTVASPAVRSSHEGASGGKDAYTFTLTTSGAPFTHRARLEESLDAGTSWAVVALFLGAPIVRADCGGCRFRIATANPAGSALTVTVAASGDLVLVTP
jgi:hypothetical protein